MSERPQSILVIEDDPAVAEALVEGISDEGYDVHWEATGAAGGWAVDAWSGAGASAGAAAAHSRRTAAL